MSDARDRAPLKLREGSIKARIGTRRHALFRCHLCSFRPANHWYGQFVPSEGGLHPGQCFLSYACETRQKKNGIRRRMSSGMKTYWASVMTPLLPKIFVHLGGPLLCLFATPLPLSLFCCVVCTTGLLYFILLRCRCHHRQKEGAWGPHMPYCAPPEGMLPLDPITPSMIWIGFTDRTYIPTGSHTASARYW